MKNFNLTRKAALLGSASTLALIAGCGQPLTLHPVLTLPFGTVTLEVGTSIPEVKDESTTVEKKPDEVEAVPRSNDDEGATFFETSNVRYAFGSGTIRNLPVSGEIMSFISEAVASMGSEYNIVVVSGGQPALGSSGRRRGSTRHDIDHHGYGGAVDFYLEKYGKRINPPDDRDLYAVLIAKLARNLTGIGHYGWGLHAGHGKPAFWGPDTTSASALPMFLAAYQAGRSLSQ